MDAVDLILPVGFPMVVLWGDDLVQIYNDGYRALMGIKHPEGLGQPTRECWPEVWHINAPIYDRVRQGETLTFADSLYPITRSGRLEDAWFTLSYSPLRDDGGQIAGVLVTVTETTGRVKESARRDAAEAALGEREERFRAFVTASSDVVYRMSPDWSQMWQLDGKGFLADTAEADEDWREKYILPADRERVEATIQQAIGARAMFELEHPVVRADGTPGWTHSRAVPILGADGKVVEWLGAAKDVTERRRAEQAVRESEARQSFLLKLGDALRPIGDPLEIQGEAAQLLGEHLDAGGCNYVEVDAEAGDWVIHRDYRRDGLHSIARRFRREDWPLFGEDFLRGEPMSIPDLGEYPLISPEERAATEALGLVAMIIAPITKQGRFVGGMAVTDSKPRAWTRDDMALVVEVAERTWAAVERARAETALRESEQRLSNVLEGMDECFGMMDHDLRIITQNKAALAIDGRTLSDIQGRKHSEVYPGADSAVVALYHRALAEGEPVSLEHQYGWQDGRASWLDMRAFPVPEGLAVFWRDISERKHYETRLKESEERFRLVADNISQLAWTCDTLGNVNWYNKRWLEYTGLIFEDMKSWGWEKVQHPDHAARVVAGVQRAAASGQPWEDVFPLRRHDGEYRWFDSRAMPIRNAEGAIVQWFGTNTDITDRMQAEDALRESEERFREFGENSSDVLWVTDLEAMRLEYLSPAYERIWGEPREVVAKDLSHWAETVHPEDREAARQAMPRLMAGEAYVADYRIVRPDGAVRAIRDTGFPMRNSHGKVTRAGGISQDITDIQAATERQQLLLAELQHRVRNILGMMRSLARQSIKPDQSADEYVAHLLGRIDAMARTQVLLSRDPDARVDLETLIRDELLAQTGRGEPATITGPEVILSPKAAEILALAIHELTTNSLKYGVLGAGEGSLTVRWVRGMQDGESWLTLTWRERGAGVPDGEAEAGFGTELIERRVPYELRGSASLSITDDGMMAEIAFPLREGASILQTGLAGEGVL